MDTRQQSKPLDLHQVHVTDPFWLREMDLVRNEVIPYQWEALNDRVPGASPSWWMHNMRAAARRQAAARGGKPWNPAKNMRFETLPEKGETPDPDAFYGFAFQDTDGYKWLESVSYQLMRQPDEQLQATAQSAVDAICAAQDPDGYLDTYYILGNREQAFSNLKDMHELYCLGHLTEAAVAWHQATGREDLLQAACRYADCVAARIGREEGKLRGYPGHEIAEMALVRLWEETGEDRFLEQARYFIDERGQEPSFFAQEEMRRGRKDLPSSSGYAYHQAHQPVRDQREAVGHAVRAMYLYSGMADVARITGDESLRKACETLWESTVQQKRYITGGVGATHVGEAFSRPYDLPSDTAYSETCASIGLAFFARRMLQLRPDSRYADIMEEALYNTVLAGMALDGKSFFYVNPLASDPKACATDSRLGHVKPIRQKWFGCACCPPNIARIVSSLPAYAYTASKDTLYVHLYVAGEVQTSLNGSPLKLRVESAMPWDGTVRLVVEEGSAEGTISVRLPGWSKDPKVTPVTLSSILTPSMHEALVDPKEIKEQDGYLAMSGTWSAGDRIEMTFDMPVRIMKANTHVRELSDQVCFCRGPIVWCAEAADNGGELQNWRVDAASLAGNPDQIHMEEIQIDGVTLRKLRVPARKTVPSEDDLLYREWEPDREEPGELTLIPYFAWDNRGENEMRVWLRA